RRGVRGAEVRAELAGASARATTDADGYFEICLQGDLGDLPGTGWQEVCILLDSPPEAAGAVARAPVYLRPAESRCVVISDIDDTVVQTGVANKLRMFWNLFFEDVESRVAYPGVAEFYRQLRDGASGDQGNPMLYVSRGPWAIYEILELFFQRHGVPEGPILFLREWGMTLQRPLPPPAKDHKLALIRGMLAVYDDAPFVLIGDSGQQDPEIYAQIVREHPERVRAIYIRNVGHGRDRDSAIASLAEEVAAAGAELLLADDTVTMARHAVRHGLVDAAAPALVRGERTHDEQVAQ
ncbi:MAG: phosphatase domain-containing protein, partial [Tistlia sp.]